MSPLSRRTFISTSSAGVVTAAVVGPAGVAEALPMEAANVLPASEIPKFASSLVVPGTLPRRSTLGGVDSYELAQRQIEQQMLPAGFPRTPVMAYGDPANSASFHSPSATIKAKRGRPVRIRWRNELVDAAGNFRPHLLPVDPSLHWANVPQEPGHGGIVSTDITPDFAGRTYARPEDYTDPQTQYTLYDGPVPIVPHLHGAEAVQDHSDGYSEAWFLPNAADIPLGYARTGRWFDHLAAKGRASGLSSGLGWVDYQYPNRGRSSTLWMHDHVMGMTRLNVYAGPAAFYHLEDTLENWQVRDRNSWLPATLPTWSCDLSLAIQDRTFHRDGTLFYPDARQWFDPAYEGSFYPESEVRPAWVPEFFGNAMLVNGRTWPTHQVRRRRHRVRLLNGCNARTLYLDFSRIPGLKAHLIANDAGYIPGPPLDLMAQTGWRRGLLVMAPAERYELILDFSDVRPGRHVLHNVGPDAFFGGGAPGVDFDAADPATTGQVMAFDVTGYWPDWDITTPAANLVLPGPAPLPQPVRTRRLATTMHFGMHDLADGGQGLMGSKTHLGVIHGEVDGPVHIQELTWSDPVTENPGVGETEDWVFYNIRQEVGIPHPLHVHQSAFEIVERGTFSYEMDGAYTSGTLRHTGLLPVNPEDRGRKDTTFVYPGEYVRIRLRFMVAGQFMWHCHLLEHEDHEMMRPFRVGPVDPNAPAPLPHPGGHEHVTADAGLPGEVTLSNAESTLVDPRAYAESGLRSAPVEPEPVVAPEGADTATPPATS